MSDQDLMEDFEKREAERAKLRNAERIECELLLLEKKNATPGAIEDRRIWREWHEAGARMSSTYTECEKERLAIYREDTRDVRVYRAKETAALERIALALEKIATK